MKNNQTRTIFPTIQLLFGTIIWGSSFFITKDAVLNINPAILIAYRFLFATAIMYFIIFLKKKNLYSGFKEGIVLGLIYSVAYLAQTIGIQFTTSTNSGFITGLFVIVIPVISFLFFRKKPKLVFLFSLVLAVSGLWILTGGIKGMNKGDFITFLTPLFVALYTVVVEKISNKKLDSVVLCFHQLWVMSLTCFMFGVVSGASFSVNGINIWLAIIYLAIFPACVSFLLQLKAQETMDANRVGIITSLEPIFASLFAYFFANEIIGINTVVGGSLIFGSMIISEVFSLLKTSNKK